MSRSAARLYFALVTLAAGWAAFNCLYVYFVVGERAAYRIESAALIFVGVALPLVASRVAAGPQPESGGRTARSGNASSGLPEILAAAAVAGAWLAIFLPLLRFPFLSDDYSFLGAYRHLPDAARPFQFFRPAFAALFALLGGAGGGSPAAFHAASFVLHLGSAVCVYRLARRLTGGPALLAGAVFLLNPAQGEAVLWASGLQDVLWTFFVLAALACYVGRDTLTGRQVVPTAALVAAALASKETAVCAVLLLPVIDGLCFRFRRGRWMWGAYAIVAAETLVYVALRSRMVTTDASFFVAPSHYFWKQMLVTPYEVFLHPWNRTAYGVPAAVLCASALLMIAALWWASRAASLRVLVGPAWIAISVLPVYSLFFVGPDLAGARYVYFAAAGFGLLLAEVAGTIVRARVQSLLAVAAVSAVFTASLVLNLRPWRSAADLVVALGDAVASGADAGDTIRAWQAQHPPGLVLKAGIPDAYQGVWVFRNGYDEFVRRASAR